MEQFRAILEQWRTKSTGGFIGAMWWHTLAQGWLSLMVPVVGAIQKKCMNGVRGHPGELESHLRAVESTVLFLTWES
jgi:hypothetical protein